MGRSMLLKDSTTNHHLHNTHQEYNIYQWAIHNIHQGAIPHNPHQGAILNNPLQVSTLNPSCQGATCHWDLALHASFPKAFKHPLLRVGPHHVQIDLPTPSSPGQPSTQPLNRLVHVGCHVCQKISIVKVGPSATIFTCSRCKEITVWLSCALIGVLYSCVFLCVVAPGSSPSRQTICTLSV